MEERKRNARRSDQEWTALIKECRTSGISDKEWCELHGIPVCSFYTKITKLRRKAFDVPAAKHTAIPESQQVVPLPIIEEVSEPCRNEITASTDPVAVVLKMKQYCIEISNYAARDTILNTLSVLQQLC